MSFIDEHRHLFGVEPICRVLTEHGWPIASSTYRAVRAGLPSVRQRRDERLTPEIRRVHRGNYRAFGARKVWLTLNREGIPVARCTIERLMRQHGWRGVVRGRRVRTTIADESATRPADRVQRNFTADRPNRLWVADFTYVATWNGMVYVAFVIDAFARRVLGWRAATMMKTSLVLDALEMAIWSRGRSGVTDLHGLIHHNDAGSQGGFNWSSQHLDHGGVRWGAARSRCLGRRWVRGVSGRRIGRCDRRCVHRGVRSRLVRCSGTSGG